MNDNEETSRNGSCRPRDSQLQAGERRGGPSTTGRSATRILAAALLAAALCVRAETPRERYERTHRDRGPTTQFGAPPHTADTNSFRFVEYLESTGTQYIDTGVYVGPGSRSETDVAVMDWDASTYALSGTTQTDCRHTFGKGWAGSSTGTGNSSKLYFGLGAQNYASSISLAGLVGVRHVYWIDATNKRAGMDDRSFSLTSTGTIGACRTTSILLAQSVGSTIRGWMAARLYGCRYYESGVLVRDFRPAVDADGVACLLDLVEGRPYYSATDTPLVAGPLVDLSAPVALSPEDQREFLAPRTDAPPEAADGDAWLDLVAIPEGVWLVERPVAGTATSVWHCALCDSRTLAALAWRHATGLAPTNLPVTLEHDPANVIGRIDRVFYERGTGIVARVQVSADFFGRPDARTHRVSADVRCFTTGTNVALRSDGWVHESQAYWSERAARLEAAAAATSDPGYAARLSAELARIAALTNPPAVSAVATAPIYLRGLSFVRRSPPLLPTSQTSLEAHGVAPGRRNAYPTPSEWTGPRHLYP